MESCNKVCLVRHYNVYHDAKCERLHFCSECNDVFKKKSDLLLHMNQHRPKSQKLFHCAKNGCDRVFADEETFKYHLSRLHSNNLGKYVIVTYRLMNKLFVYLNFVMLSYV